MLMIYLFLLIISMKSTYNKSPSKNNQCISRELNKNNKIYFLDVLIDTKNNNSNFTTVT